MSYARIDLGPLPAGAKSVWLEYRRKGYRNWYGLGETTDQVSYWQLTGGSVEVQAVVRDQSGKLLRPGRTVSWDTEEALADVPLPKDVTTWPDPVVTQDGPTLTVTPKVAPGLDPDDYEMEVRQGEDGDTPKNGLQVGFTDPGQPIECFAWPTSTGTQTIHVRGHRLSDGRVSDWTTVDFTSPTPTILPTTGHTNDFASGTLVTTDGGIAPLEINGGDLRFKAIYAGDVDGGSNYAGDFTDVYAGDCDLYWSPASYTTDTVTLSVAEPLVFQVYPDMTGVTRKTNLYAGDCHWPASMPRTQTDGTYYDPRVFERSLQNGADETPMVMSQTVSINAGSHEALIPGRVYPAVASYAVKFTFSTFLQKQLTINNLYVRHWIWCRGRPWHSHSDAFELIHENTLTSASATYDVSLSGDNYDEMFLEVTWKNADSTPTNLWLRPNNDSGANYDLDGAGDSKIVVGPSGTVAQNEWEYARVRFHNPVSGAQRGITVEQNGRWTTTTSQSSDASDTYVWTNTASEITTIRVTVASGNVALAIGTTTRLWGKRHHTE